MKRLLTLAFIIFSASAFGQQMTSSQWDGQAATNIRLLPKYGHQPKTDEQKQIDAKFIDETMKQPEFMGDRKEASGHLIELGFTYLYRNDLKTAMYRFNQAYLLDSANSDIYWGYGAVYMNLGDYQKAQKQYLEGISISPQNTHLLTDYGTYFMAQFYGLESIDKPTALANLDSAVNYLTRSYRLDPKDQNTSFKLSVSYWNRGDCDNAWKYYDVCKLLGGQPITEDYTRNLSEKCRRQY